TTWTSDARSNSMVDAISGVLSSTLPAAPIAGAPDALHAPGPRPARSDDPFGPAVIIGSSVQAPSLVIYDAEGRLTTALPAHPADGVTPPAHIDVDHPDTPYSLIYTG